MSIVIACATNNRVVIKSDGREIDAVTKQVVSEDSEKIRQITTECYIGYTGSKQFCEYALDCFAEALDHQNPFENIQILQELIKGMCESKPNDCNFIIAGKWQNKIILWVLSGSDAFDNITDESPTQGLDEIKQVAVGSRQMEGAANFTDMYNRDVSIESNMNDYIRYAATISEDINDHISTRKVRI